MEVKLSTILDPFGSNPFTSCPQAMSFFQGLCPAPFPPVSAGGRKSIEGWVRDAELFNGQGGAVGGGGGLRKGRRFHLNKLRWTGFSGKTHGTSPA